MSRAKGLGLCLIRWWNVVVVSGSLWRIGGPSSSFRFVSFPLPDRQGQETVDDETLKAMSPLKSARFFD